ncbi:MAG: hypothetical protein ABSE77_02505 [Acidimicrobiales bacterium]
MGSQAAGRAGAGWPGWRAAGAAFALLAAIAAVPLVAPAAQAQVGSALADPPDNVPRTPAMEQACSGGAGPCQQAVVHAIDVARAAEGVGPLELPSYYDTLSVAEQLLVLTDLERVDRGLAGFTGLSSKLDALSKVAASSNQDPAGPAGTTWGSNWAGGEASALLADYDWMYDDGPRSPNMDCTNAVASGCWDHRRNILSNYGPHPALGAATTTVDGVTSMTELLTSGPAGALDYAMPEEVAPQLVSPSSLVIGTTPLQPNSATLTVRDGNGSFQASATVSGDEGQWSVTPLCTAPAGTTCQLVVNFVPVRNGPANGTVTVNLPDGSEQVPVNAYAGHGYWEATTEGGVFAFAGGGFRGSAAGLKLAKPVTGMVATPDGGGYWEVAADGGVFSFGDAHFYGSAADMRVGQPFVGMAATPDGGGYWLVARTGRIYTFGDAEHYGSPDVPLTDIVGISATKDGRGYWLVASDGSIYTFGDAQFYGVPPVPSEGEFVGMAASPEGHGYWLVTRNGTIFAFGDAKYYGSASKPGPEATVGMAVPVTGTGYYIVDADGAVTPFGGAPAWGRAANVTPKSPVVAMATA